MSQESIDDFMQLAKDYAKAEKELEYSIGYSSVSNVRTVTAIMYACSAMICPVKCTSADGG